jgi:hypothetical protein
MTLSARAFSVSYCSSSRSTSEMVTVVTSFLLKKTSGATSPGMEKPKARAPDRTAVWGGCGSQLAFAFAVALDTLMPRYLSAGNGILMLLYLSLSRISRLTPTLKRDVFVVAHHEPI